MKTSEIYEKYQIPDNLAKHMYRVAAVGRVVADYLKENIDLDKDLITTVLLLHDMGNIIKYDFKKTPKIYWGEGVSINEEIMKKWRKIQADFIAKYGGSEKVATFQIARELGISEKATYILENIGSSKVHLVLDGDDWYLKVCSYADFRVAPYGVESVVKRWDDIISRYEGRTHSLGNLELSRKKKANALILENQIQEKCKEDLSSIDNKIIAPILAELEDFEIVNVKV
jgi:predicted HD phosphohydrolase